MSKKYTKADMRSLLSNVLCGAFEHMDAIHKDITKLNIKDENDDPNKVARAKVLTLTLTVINDIIHPAHKFAYSVFKGAEDFLDLCIKNQKIAIDKKLVPPCKCEACPREADVPKTNEGSGIGKDSSRDSNTSQ